MYWQDANGSTFVLSSLGDENLNTHPLVVEDCTVELETKVIRRFHNHGEGPY